MQNDLSNQDQTILKRNTDSWIVMSQENEPNFGKKPIWDIYDDIIIDYELWRVFMKAGFKEDTKIS